MSDERGAQRDKWTVVRLRLSLAAIATPIIVPSEQPRRFGTEAASRSRDMDIDELVKAVQTLNADDAFRARLTLDNWRTIAPYLARYEIRAGDLLIKQGDADRSMYFLAQGSMQIFMTGGPPGSSKVAILRAGAVVGEPGLFGDTPRMANVEAMTPCVVWALRGPRMEELAQRSPALALELLRAAGAVMATRMRATLSKQMPIT
jgi:signal-transduction protein with cAMP-binding, CBS, and nucleotidyltransferase domain